MSPFYTTLFILCPFDIASCLLELCEEAGWLHAVTGTSSQSLVCWWVTLLLCACEHIPQVPTPLPFELLGSRGGKGVQSINYKNNLGSKISCPVLEHNNQRHSGRSASESVQVHPVIRWAAGEGTSGAHSSCLKAGKCTKTFQLRQEVSLLKIGLYWCQALFYPFSQLAIPSSAWAGLPPSTQRMHCLRRGSAPPQPGLLWRTQPSCQEEMFSHSPCSESSSLKRNSPELTKAELRTCVQINLCITTLQNCSYPKHWASKPKTALLPHSPACTYTLRISIFSIIWQCPNIKPAL